MVGSAENTTPFGEIILPLCLEVFSSRPPISKINGLLIKKYQTGGHYDPFNYYSVHSTKTSLLDPASGE